MMMISLDFTAGIYKMKINVLDIGQPVTMYTHFHSLKLMYFLYHFNAWIDLFQQN